MRNQPQEARAESIQLLLPWGTPLAERDDGPGRAVFWMAGGASLLLWTAVALLLTAV
jgi:hypothetical protein